MTSITDYLKKTTKVYDASQNSATIAGLTLDGITDIKIKYEELTKKIYGTHGSYTTIVKQNPKCATVTISLYPVANCLTDLKRLEHFTQTVGGFFETMIKKNGDIVIQGKSWIIKAPDQSVDQDGGDMVYEFGVDLYTQANVTAINTSDLSNPLNIPPITFQ